MLKEAEVKSFLLNEASSIREKCRHRVIKSFLLTEAQNDIGIGDNSDLVREIEGKWRSGYRIDESSLRKDIVDALYIKLESMGIDSDSPDAQVYYKHFAVIKDHLTHIPKTWRDDLSKFELSLILENLTSKDSSDNDLDNTWQKDFSDSIEADSVESTSDITKHDSPKPMPEMSVPVSMSIPQDYVKKRRNKDRRLITPRPVMGSVEEKLLKSANILDQKGETILADKIDILLSKIKEAINV